MGFGKKSKLPCQLNFIIMNWKKLSRVIIPLIIVKVIIIVFFILSGDSISISRDMNVGSNYQQGIEGDSIVIKRQKFVRISRNESRRGISIIFRGRKNNRPAREKEGEGDIPLAD